MAVGKAEIQVVATGITQVNAALGGLESRIATFAAGAGKLLGGLASGYVATQIVQGFRSIVGGMEEIYEAAQKVGMSTESLSGLKYAAEQSGVSFEQLTGGLVKFSRAIVEAQTGNKELASLLQQIGVSAQDTAETGLAKVAEAFSKMPDGIAKTDAAVRLFGRSGAELIPFLNEGAAGLDRLREEARRLGVEISGEAAKAADDFGDNLDKLGSAAVGAGNSIANSLLPYLVDVTNALVIAAKEGRGLAGVLESIGKQIGSGLFEKFNGIQATAKAISDLGKEIRQIEADIAKTKGEDWFFGDLQQTRIQNQTAKLAKLQQQMAELGVTYKRQQAEVAAVEDAEERHGEMLELNAKRVTLTVVAEEKKTKARQGGAKATNEAAKAEERYGRQLTQLYQQEALRYVKLTQSAEVARDFELALQGVEAADRAALVAQSAYNDSLEASKTALEQAGKETGIYAEVVEDAARGMRSAFSSFFEDLLTDGTKAFKDFGDTVKRLFIKLLADLMSAALANPIQILLGISTAGATGAAAASAGSVATGGAASSAGGGLLGNLGTSLLGGITGFSSALYGGLGALGTAALGGAPAGLLGTAGNLLSFGSAGITSGSLAGLASGLGAVASVALPVLGIAAAIAGLAGLFKDKNPDEQWFRLVSGTRTGVDAAKAPISNATTAFGAVGISGHEDLAGDGREFAARVTETIVAIDQQIAASFTQAQIDAAKAALEGTMSHSPEFGGDASMNADQAVAVALKQRYATLFAAVDQSIADEIAGAANSTEAVGQVISKVTEKAAIRRQIEDQIKAVQAWIDGVLDQAIVAPENKHLAWRLMDANQLVRNMTAALDGSLQSIANLAAALQSRAALAIEYLAAIQGVTGDIEAVIGRTASAAPDQSLSAQLATSADKVREYAAGLNTSVESHQALLAVITERYALEVQYLTTIKALSAEISATLAATAETIRTAFFTPQESYDYLKDRANAASASLATATTPEQVQAIIATINQATQSAWQTLGADTVEQRAKQQEFLTFLTEVDALAQERLAVVEQAAQQESADLRGTVSDAMDRMATSVDNLVRATGALNAATNKLNEIMPTALTVNVAAAGYA